MKRNLLITLIIILLVIIIAIIIMNNRVSNTDEQTAKCIGQNSILYTQLGCHACENQKKIFGENYKYLRVIDCFYEREKCDGITGTPTWEISGQKIIGVQSIDKLKELTGC